MNSIIDLIIPSANAQAASGAGAEGGGFSLAIMCAGFLVFMYFAIWRPQTKRAREQQNLLESLAKGDEVVSTGGLLGRIEKVEGQHITLSISQNVNVLVQKTSIVSVLPKGTLKSIAQDVR